MAKTRRGFTLIELMVVVAIIAILAAVAVPNLGRLRTRAKLSSTAMELQGALQLARQSALANGRDAVVMFFPAEGTWGGALGRVVVLLDGDGGFMDGTGGTNLDAFSSSSPSAGPIGTKNSILTQIDLPRGITIGPPLAAATATFPFTAVPAPGAAGCSFCDAGRGAIRFDERGRAHFYSKCGPTPADAGGGSVSLNTLTAPGDPVEMVGTSTLMILPSGIVRSYHAS